MKTITIKRFPALSYSGQESFNTLYTNVSFCGETAKKLMITSSHSHEGKSYISMNLMRTMAENGKRVVLVDADLRRSCIIPQYRLVNDQAGPMTGLVHLLAGMAEVSDVVYATNISNAYIIPIGRTVSNPLPLLNSGRFHELLEDLATHFDYVLIDAPPIGLVIDAAEMAKSCSGALMTIAYNEVHRNELLEAKRQLEQTGCPILGTVLNGVELTNYNSRRYYKSYYSYYTNVEEDGDKSRKDKKAKVRKDK